MVSEGNPIWSQEAEEREDHHPELQRVSLAQGPTWARICITDNQRTNGHIIFLSTMDVPYIMNTGILGRVRSLQFVRILFLPRLRKVIFWLNRRFSLVSNVPTRQHPHSTR